MHKPPTEALVYGDSSCDRRIRRPLGSFVLLAFLFLLGPDAVSTKAQQTSLEAIGIPPFTTMLPVQNGYINTVNGDLHLEISFSNLAERAGQQFKAALMYDSNIWSNTIGPFNVPGGSGPNSTSMGGWRLLTSAHPGGTDYNINDFYCSDGVSVYREDYNFWFYVAPDGTTKYFPIFTQAYFATKCHQAGGTPSSDAVATDGSGYHMYVTNYTNAVVYSPDGTQVYNDSSYGEPKDANGNYSGSPRSYNPPLATDMNPSHKCLRRIFRQPR